MLCSTLATATSFTQYLPSPTTENLIRVFAFNNDKAYAVSSNVAHCLFYNGSWNEINCPNDALDLTNYTWYSRIDKTSDGNVFFGYYNLTGGVYSLKVVKFNVATQNYSLIATLTSATIFSNFVCITEDNTCYAQDINTGGDGHWIGFQVYPTLSNFTTNNSGSVVKLVGSNDGLFGQTYLGNAWQLLYEWNGVSWVLRFTSGLGSWINGKINVHSTTNKAFNHLSGIGNLARYNYTTGLFNAVTSSWNFVTDTNLIDFEGSYVALTNSGYNITSLDYSSLAHLTDYSIASPMNSFDVSPSQSIVWAVGNGGLIYYLNSTSADVYSLSASASPNPTFIGEEATFYATAYSPDGYSSNITFEIDSVGYLVSVLDVPSGTTASVNIEGLDWQNFAVNNYTLEVSSISTGLDTASSTITWRVTDYTYENQTYYSLTGTELQSYDCSEFTSINLCESHSACVWASPNCTGSFSINNVFSVDDAGEETSWATGKSGSSFQLFKITSSDVNNLVIENFTITKDTVGSLTTLSSIAVNGDFALIGTNNELYIYNGTSIGNAITLNNSAMYDAIKDTFNDVTDGGVGDAFVCHDGLLSDKALFYNITTATFEHIIAESPCNSLLYDATSNALFIHKGVNGVKIYNVSDDGLLSSITGFSSISTSTHDRISHNNDYLFIITSHNTITKYDVSNLSAPVKIDDCKTTSDKDVVSIEALSDDEIIIGTKRDALADLEICDFSNNDTYYGLQDFFYSTKIITLPENAVPYEIVANADDKISVAFSNGVAVYKYFKTSNQTQINQAPIIDGVSIDNSAPCINETIYITINASDFEGNTIFYDVSCDATTRSTVNDDMQRYNEFICTYTSTGGYDILSFANDGNQADWTTTNSHITVQNCTANPKIQVRVTDYLTGTDLQGATVDVDGNTTLTGVNGKAYISVSDKTTPHTLSVSMDNYREETYANSVYGGGSYVVRLQPTSFGSGTGVLIITQNGTGSLIGGTFVSLSNTLTGENVYGFSNVNGEIAFYDVFSCEKCLLVGENQELGYEKATKYFTLNTGEQKTVILNLSNYWDAGKWSVTTRGCQDTIKGVWLCGNLSVTGTGSSCTTDANCISGKCGYGGVGGRECSKFNWTICDDKGTNRGNTCMFSATAEGFFGGVTSFILHRLIWVIVFIMIVAVIIILRKKD